MLGIPVHDADVTAARTPIRADASDWQRLAAIVRTRREELGIRQADAVARSDGRISLPVWSILENARQRNGAMDRSTLRGAALALDWPEEYLERQLGVDAPTGQQEPADLRVARLEAEVATLRAAFLKMAEAAGQHVDLDVPVEPARERQ